MIYIDASRYNNTKKRTGVENYSYFLINELIKLDSEITLISPKKINIDAKQITIPFPRLWTQIRLSWEVLVNKKINNLFIPSHLLPLISPKNSTITIHDVAWKHVPKSYGFLSKLYLEWGTKFAVKHAKKIITPSEVTKNDLIKFYKTNSKKINVIPLGFEYKNVGNTDLYSIPKNIKSQSYFLFLGRLEHKKNTDTLIKAFSSFAENNKDVKLVLAGSTGRGGKEIINNIPVKLRERIIMTGYVSEKQKHVLLKNALCFIFPSRYEGFGIPLLEAMSYNLPIIASNIPTSKEIAKENALFFETENANELTELMEKVLIQNNNDNLIINHQKTLEKYSWKKCAINTLKILKEV